MQGVLRHVSNAVGTSCTFDQPYKRDALSLATFSNSSYRVRGDGRNPLTMTFLEWGKVNERCVSDKCRLERSARRAPVQQGQRWMQKTGYLEPFLAWIQLSAGQLRTAVA